jgi:transposase
MRQERKSYDKVFKLKAVELSLARNNVKDVALDLGVSSQLLSVWRKKYKDNKGSAFPGNGNIQQTSSEKEMAELKRELKDVKMERDILKKAISIFSTSDRKNLYL